MKNFNQRIEELRGDRTQKVFAKTLGIPINTYTNWVRGIRTPTAEGLYKICTQLGVSADWLLGLSDQQHPDYTVRDMPKRGLSAADTCDSVYLSGQEQLKPCPHCAARQAQIDKLVDTLHNLSLGRSLPAPRHASESARY